MKLAAGLKTEKVEVSVKRYRGRAPKNRRLDGLVSALWIILMPFALLAAVIKWLFSVKK